MRTARTAAAALLGAALACGTAAAQTLSVSVSPAGDAPALGRIVRGVQPSVFSISASTGTVTRTSGDAVRIASSVTTTPTVTIRCTGTGSLCSGNARRFTITLQSVTGIGPGVTVTNLQVTSPTGATVFGGPTYSNGSLVLVVGPFSTLQFRVGMSVQVPAGGTTGNATLPFTVNVARTA
jgi:hypothetical protein